MIKKKYREIFILNLIFIKFSCWVICGIGAVDHNFVFSFRFNNRFYLLFLIALYKYSLSSCIRYKIFCCKMHVSDPNKEVKIVDMGTYEI